MSSCTKEKTYIEFELLREKKRTNEYLVKNIKSKNTLGIIKWNGAWRQYCFYPSFDTVWSVGCLQDVQNFINKLMEERKRRLKQAHKH